MSASQQTHPSIESGLRQAGYALTEQLYESPTALVYRAQRESEQFPIILKVLKAEYPSPEELIRSRQEYEITHSLELPGVVQVYSQQPYQNTLVMEVEDFGGRSLDLWLQEQSFPLVDVLRLGLRLTETLGQVHAANVIHKDINPANIVWNPDTDTLKLIDFGIATRLSRETPTITTPHRLDGTLAYLSPEQTGRMNRVVDYRTDYYSLGVTLYELLTGHLPFSGADALELVHAHLAKPPVPPQMVKGEIPAVVSALVCKLLAKNAEERYQSAQGLQTDLERCLHHVEANGAVPTFTLAERDVAGQFQIPQRLYGREAEIETLLSAFERVSQGK